MTRIIVPLLVVAFAGWSAAGTGDGWSELETPNFRLLSNAPDQATVAVGTGLERLRQALVHFPGGLDLEPRGPLTVYVFRDWGSSKKLLPGSSDDRPGGLFFVDPDAAHITVHAERGFDAPSLAYHEYLHYVLEQNLPALPLWFKEGLAELYGTFRATEHEAEIGLPVPAYFDVIRHGRILPTAELFEVTTTSWEYREPRRKQVFHAQSWVLTHELMLGGDQVPPAILERFRNGTPPAVLFSSVAAMTRDRLTAYIDTIDGRVVHVPLSDTPRLVGVPRELPRDEALQQLAGLLLYQAESASRAEKLYRKAIALNEENAGAHAGLGRLLSAVPSLRRAVELDPSDGMFAYYLARELARRGGRTHLEEIRLLLERSVAAQPGFVAPRAALERLRAAERGD